MGDGNKGWRIYRKHTTPEELKDERKSFNMYANVSETKVRYHKCVTNGAYKNTMDNQALHAVEAAGVDVEVGKLDHSLIFDMASTSGHGKRSS